MGVESKSFIEKMKSFRVMGKWPPARDPQIRDLDRIASGVPAGLHGGL